MVSLKYIEDEAQRLADKQDELAEIEDELEAVITELRDLPRKAARETKFAKFVGKEPVSEKRVEELEQRQDELADRREALSAEIEDKRESLMREFTSDELTVPLSMEPAEHEHEWVFPFRGSRTYPYTLRFLNDTIGLGDPIRLEGVLITEAEVRVPTEEFDMDETEAMEAVMEAFDQLQNTLEMKLPDEDEW